MIGITSVSLRLDDASICVIVMVGKCGVYLHGSTRAAREFAAKIIAQCDEQDASPLDFGESLEANMPREMTTEEILESEG